ncbi:MAG: transcriptional repressor [Chloroflexi bacterium]|nr:transcriptional repressor [Chloroflexota bacterium]
MAEIRTSRYAQALKAGGHKLTRPRLAVIEVLVNESEHLSPAEIYILARKIYPEIGLTTVYRTLELLTEMGLLRPNFVGDARQRFSSSATGHHHHLVCIHCAALIEIEDCGLEEIEDRLVAQTTYQILGHYVEFYGICDRCRSIE